LCREGGGENSRNKKKKSKRKEKKGEEIKRGGISYLYRPRSKPSDVFDTTT
jgi:hypothetical protein